MKQNKREGHCGKVNLIDFLLDNEIIECNRQKDFVIIVNTIEFQNTLFKLYLEEKLNKLVLFHDDAACNRLQACPVYEA